jgi:hypothetical protein
MIWIVTFGLACLIWRYRWLAHVGWISIFVLAQVAMWPDEPKAKDPTIPEISAPAKSAPPGSDTAVHGEDQHGRSSTGAQIGRGWQPEYDPNAPAGPYGGNTEEATPTAPPGSLPGRVPSQQTCVTSAVAGPCPQPGAPYMAGAPRMPPGYAGPNGAYRARPRVMDNRGGGGRN